MPVLRGLERVLPVPVFYWVVFPVPFCRAILHQIRKGNLSRIELPACLSRDDKSPRPVLARLPVYFNRIMEFIPAALARPKWQARCSIEGLEPVRQAVAQKRGVLLAFPHFSLYGQLRNWLRGAGLPVAFFAGADSSLRSDLKRHKDRWALFPEVPTVFGSDRLADAIRFVRAGNPLLIALDGPRGRKVELPAYDGWVFRMPTGPLRIAARHDALIFPCTMIVDGIWRFRIKIGDPVPAELLAEGKEREAGLHLLRQILPIIERHSDQCRIHLLECFKPSTPPSASVSKAS